ncbi:MULTISPECIES: fimbrial protein [unclassified Serratia (in: enterobacteria)]|uniref:fimbrial protein n=1 Tax=unclassified Serratia (in: enterobacteria) TaxID=2647522 RepID=UPI000505A3EE|nr:MULTISPECIES: fimbrial protein [unclassified Serratia (in: enterobacteria)]KFK94087.1 hypothetical protein JV45_13740 [Serratia sp. Ag2]KFL00576.1 hypothetical protein IV04_00910 [Serratia sp. Ag1]
MISTFSKYKIIMLLKVLGLLLTCVFSIENAYALACANASDGTLRYEENIGSISVPQTLANGTTVWRSENRTMRVQCWKDRPQTTAENVYFYLNPNSATLGSGVHIGVNLGGIDIPDVTNAQKQMVPNVVVPACTGSSDYCKAYYSANFTINYYVYITKNGSNLSGNYSGKNVFDVFQIDGVGGLNNVAGNFRYAVNNMQGIRFLPCQASLLSPGTVDFGKINNAPAVVGAVAKNVGFNVDITKNCTNPMVLTALYSSSSAVYDANTRVLLNGVGLKIKNLETNNYIGYSGVESFTSLGSETSKSIPFSAEVVWLNNKPSPGTFNSTLTITMYYN